MQLLANLKVKKEVASMDSAGLLLTSIWKWLVLVFYFKLKIIQLSDRLVGFIQPHWFDWIDFNPVIRRYQRNSFLWYLINIRDILTSELWKTHSWPKNKRGVQSDDINEKANVMESMTQVHICSICIKAHQAEETSIHSVWKTNVL